MKQKVFTFALKASPFIIENEIEKLIQDGYKIDSISLTGVECGCELKYTSIVVASK